MSPARGRPRLRELLSSDLSLRIPVASGLDAGYRPIDVERLPPWSKLKTSIPHSGPRPPFLVLVRAPRRRNVPPRPFAWAPLNRHDARRRCSLRAMLGLGGSAEAVVDAPVDAVFALLTDPVRLPAGTQSLLVLRRTPVRCLLARSGWWTARWRLQCVGEAVRDASS